MSRIEEAVSFFRSYAEAFERSDIEALRRLWTFPALILTPAGSSALEEAAFRDNGQKLMEFYKTQGVARVDEHVVSAHSLFVDAMEARLTYRLYDAKGAEIVGWEHIYILRRTKDGWRAAMALSDGEIEAWMRRGTPLAAASPP